ncbi:MAG: hypothetical protein EPN79_11135 [Burkholderiaceae bacterium]|nr:MAG: hypothetical protein EPN79_11135 [Burkholderiaceae bacterium]TBR76762.1 MAG: hypothetical protein EPN64_05940 [Burkholderiaceae bacterium]
MFAKLSDFLWARLAAFIGARPALVDSLINTARRNHYLDIKGPDGSIYMERDWLMPRWMLRRDEDGDLRPRDWVPFGARIQHICRPDMDRHKHDHPCNYRTIVLRNYYVEQMQDGTRHRRKAGDTARAACTHWHTIETVGAGGVWTLFITGRKKQEWGFNVDGKKVHWKEYTKAGEVLPAGLRQNPEVRRVELAHTHGFYGDQSVIAQEPKSIADVATQFVSFVLLGIALAMYLQAPLWVIVVGAGASGILVLAVCFYLLLDSITQVEGLGPLVDDEEGAESA